MALPYRGTGREAPGALVHGSLLEQIQPCVPNGIPSRRVQHRGGTAWEFALHVESVCLNSFEMPFFVLNRLLLELVVLSLADEPWHTGAFHADASFCWARLVIKRERFRERTSIYFGATRTYHQARAPECTSPRGWRERNISSNERRPFCCLRALLFGGASSRRTTSHDSAPRGKKQKV